jgi:hypothetical protein
MIFIEKQLNVGCMAFRHQLRTLRNSHEWETVLEERISGVPPPFWFIVTEKFLLFAS